MHLIAIKIERKIINNTNQHVQYLIKNRKSLEINNIKRKKLPKLNMKITKTGNTKKV